MKERGSPEGTSGDPKSPEHKDPQKHRDKNPAPEFTDAVHQEASIRMHQMNGSSLNQEKPSP
jgi:hypothetical protein